MSGHGHPVGRTGPSTRATVLAGCYGLAIWAAATAAIVAVGDRVLSPIDTAAGVAAVVVAGVVTAALARLLVRDFVRRAGGDRSAAALLFAVVAGAGGLALDALLLLATGFD